MELALPISRKCLSLFSQFLEVWDRTRRSERFCARHCFCLAVRPRTVDSIIGADILSRGIKPEDGTIVSEQVKVKNGTHPNTGLLS